MKTMLRSMAVLAAAVLLAVPPAAQAQKTIKVGLALSKGAPGFDFINGMYELFKAEVEAGTKGTLQVELVYGGALGNPNDRMNQMRRGAIQMSDAADGNYASIYPDIQVLSIPYLFASEQAAWKVRDGPSATPRRGPARKDRHSRARLVGVGRLQALQLQQADPRHGRFRGSEDPRDGPAGGASGGGDERVGLADRVQRALHLAQDRRG